MQKNKRLIAEIVKGEEVLMTIDGNMLSCEFGALDRGNLTDVVDWGIYANRGSLSFIDKAGYFNNSNINSQELKNAKVRFYLVKSDRDLIATFEADNFEYDDESKQVDVDLISGLAKWQSLSKRGSIFPYYETDVFDLTSLVSQYFGKQISVDGFAKKTYIFCPLIRQNESLWSIVTKLCQATMGRVVETPDGSAIITDAFFDRQPIVVKPKNILGISNESFVIIENSSMDVTNRQRIVDTAKLDFTINWSGYANDISENTVLEHNGASMTFDEQFETATANGCVKTNNEIFEVHDPYIERTMQEQKFPISNTSFPNQKPSFLPYPLWEMDGIQLVASDDKYREICFSCSGLPIKTSSIDSTTSIRTSETVVTGGALAASYDTFSDEVETITNITDEGYNVINIQSNDLIQTKSSYDHKEGGLGAYILSEVKKRYGKGIECFEIECLFNEYRDESGNVVFDGNDLSQHFQKYDIIIPYVRKKGQTVPLRTNPDGTPKKFRIIGISYSYDGLLKQKLSVQEERYDID